jgi:YhcH/YjgK/YiaL family protein
MTVKTPYNPDKDVVFFEDNVEGLSPVVGAGQFLIFRPWDAHMPKVAAGQPAPIKKVIVKIKED